MRSPSVHSSDGKNDAKRLTEIDSQQARYLSKRASASNLHYKNNSNNNKDDKGGVNSNPGANRYQASGVDFNNFRKKRLSTSIDR